MRRAAGTLSVCAALVAAQGARADYKPGIPPAVDPGTPTYGGLADPVPAEPSGPVPDGDLHTGTYSKSLTFTLSTTSP